MVESDLEGGCQCGALRYRVIGEPLMAAICHCTMCRRAKATLAVAWAMFQESQVAFLGGRPTTYASSPEARRGFCPVCGTQICFTASYIPGLIDITIGSLDRPELVTPTLHCWHSRRLPWSILPTTSPGSRSSRRSSEVEVSPSIRLDLRDRRPREPMDGQALDQQMTDPPSARIRDLPGARSSRRSSEVEESPSIRLDLRDRRLRQPIDGQALDQQMTDPPSARIRDRQDPARFSSEQVASATAGAAPAPRLPQSRSGDSTRSGDLSSAAGLAVGPR